MYFAIFGGRLRVSVKWCIKSFSISLKVVWFAEARSFRFARELATFFESFILSSKLGSQSLQMRPFAEWQK